MCDSGIACLKFAFLWLLVGFHIFLCIYCYLISFVNCLFCPLSLLIVFCTGWFVLFLLINRDSSGIDSNDLSESQVSSFSLWLVLFIAFVLTFVVVPNFFILIQVHVSIFPFIVLASGIIITYLPGSHVAGWFSSFVVGLQVRCHLGCRHLKVWLEWEHLLLKIVHSHDWSWVQAIVGGLTSPP